MHCAACHRSLKNPPVMVGGVPYGPKCAAKAGKPIPAHDLFGFRPEVFAEELVDKAHAEFEQKFAVALRRRMEALA